MRIVLAGGGSGGHITPILAVASALTQSNRELHYIGLGEARERELIATSDVITHKITAGKFRRYHKRGWRSRLLDWRTPLLNLRDIFRITAGIMQSIWLLLRLRPDVIFIKGGYVGLPVGVAAWMLRVPFLIHESDSVPGLTNRILGRLTPHRVSGFDIAGYENLGNPVRGDILHARHPNPALFDITSTKPVILAFGGSLGSNFLNHVVVDLARSSSDYEIIHITGGEKVAFEASYYHQYDFLSDRMADALWLCDVVIARGGANTLAELAALKKPSIIVPHPRLSGDHQSKNAEAMADADAVVLIRQDQLDTDTLAQAVYAVASDSKKKQELADNIAHFARRTSAEDIAKKLLSIMPTKTGEG